MLDLKYSLVIESTDDPSFFAFYSPTLQGFTGIGHSIEDCIYKARSGMAEHLTLLKERGLTIPAQDVNPTVLITNERSLVGTQ